MPHAILVPLDGSTFAEAALPPALSLARRWEVGLELVLVHEKAPTFAGPDWEAEARAWSESYLDAVRDRLRTRAPDVAVENTVRAGSVTEQLEEHAAASGARLVVMATHGRGPLSRAWLGSVADHFVRHTPCRVLLLRPEETAADEAAERGELPTWEPRRILVPLDGSDFSETVLDDARRLARSFDADLLLLQVVTYPVEVASAWIPQTVQMNPALVDEMERRARQGLEARAERLREAGERVTAEVVTGHQAAHGILEVAEREDVDLVVMATHGRGGMTRAIVGSTADKVTRGTRRPVWLRRPSEAPAR